MNSRHLYTAAVVVCTMVLHSGGALAQSADWSKVLAAANQEGKLVVYGNTLPAIIDRITEDFRKAHPGVSMQFVRIPGNTLISKIDQEQKSGADGADMALYTETPWHAERAKQGAFKAPVGPAMKGYPREYLVHGVAPVMAMQPFVIAYNSKLVTTPVNGYQDLLRPEFKGKLGTSGLVAVALVAWYQWLEQTQGTDYLQKFAAQSPRYFVGAVAGTQSVAAGELSAMAFSIPGVANPLIEQGAPLKVVYPKPSLGQRDLGVVMNWAKRPNAAVVFQDYLMSVRGQTVWNGKGETASPLPGIQGSLDPKTINVFDSGKYTSEVVKAYTEKWNKLFKTTP